MKPHGDEWAPHGEDETCGWCAPGDATGHRATIRQLEGNLGGLQVRINELETELAWYKRAYGDAIEALKP